LAAFCRLIKGLKHCMRNLMEEFLKNLMNKQVDISFGSSSTVRGDVLKVDDGVLQLRDEDERIAYVAIERIAVIWEVKDTQSRPGFVN
jgi:small nuclear ribonucleoprotein (snRNP)-like protein